jgi:uncharacterized membrane protein
MDTEQIHPTLAFEIQRYIKKGFRVTTQTNTTAQLIKPKHFSFLWAFLWFLLAGIGLLVYVIYYMAKKDEIIYLQVVNDQVTITKG